MMYFVVKDGIGFHVNSDEKAQQYKDDGYEVTRIEAEQPDETEGETITLTGTGTSPAPPPKPAERT